MRTCTLILLFLSAIGVPNNPLSAQRVLPPSEEVWPEYNLFYKFRPNQRIYFMLSGTRDELSGYADGTMGAHYDFFTFRKHNWFRQRPDSTNGYNLWFRGGYLFSTNAKSRDPYSENILLTEANARFWPFGNFLLTSKTRMDWRWNNEEFEPRLRERVTLETDIQTGYATFTPYLFAEQFFYFSNGRLNRFRLCLGSEFWLFKFLSVEFYYLYQFENEPSVSKLSAAGIVVKNYFSYRSK